MLTGVSEGVLLERMVGGREAKGVRTVRSTVELRLRSLTSVAVVLGTGEALMGGALPLAGVEAPARLGLVLVLVLPPVLARLEVEGEEDSALPAMGVPPRPSRVEAATSAGSSAGSAPLGDGVLAAARCSLEEGSKVMGSRRARIQSNGLLNAAKPAGQVRVVFFGLRICNGVALRREKGWTNLVQRIIVAEGL